MKFRCPYCGEKGFSTIEKLDFLPRLVSEYMQGARCGNCRQKVYYSSRLGGRVGRTAIVLAIPVVTVLLMVLYARLLPQAPGWGYLVILLVGAALLYMFNCFFGYFDKATEEEQRQDPVFRFTTGSTARLWPKVRVGEIYPLRFPKRGLHEDAPRIIGMVQKIEGKPGDRTVTVRVIKEFLMEAPLPEEAVWLTTEGALTIEGTVAQTYKLPPKEEE